MRSLWYQPGLIKTGLGTYNTYHSFSTRPETKTCCFLLYNQVYIIIKMALDLTMKKSSTVKTSSDVDEDKPMDLTVHADDTPIDLTVQPETVKEDRSMDLTADQDVVMLVEETVSDVTPCSSPLFESTPGPAIMDDTTVVISDDEGDVAMCESGSEEPQVRLIN